MTRSRSRPAAVGLALGLVLSGALPAAPAASAARDPGSTTAARQALVRFLTLWRIGDHAGMHAALAEPDRSRYTRVGFVDLLDGFADAVRLTGMDVAVGSSRAVARPPEPRPGSPSSSVVLGPVPAVSFPVRLTFHSALFGDIPLERRVELTRDADGWAIRWSPATVFPELGATGGTFAVERGPLPTRGRILAADGTVLAESRPDGARVYPQEWLAGQTIGFATPLTASEAAARPVIEGYATGQVAGRRGVEAGAEALLRGRAALTLIAVPHGRTPTPVVVRPEVPGADVTLTIRPAIQRVAEAALAPYAEAATVVVDPRSGDVWALASAPAFNPNAMTIGSTLAGQPLARPSTSAQVNHAVESAYPTGSSFKPFTLAAALQIDVASPATRMTCAPTWDDLGFTFRNYLNHQLPGRVSLVQAMAFSCNTTYMPLSYLVYRRDEDALTDLIADFGFGRPTGIGWVGETGGVLPDALWFEGHTRWNGRYSPFGPIDQTQLAIGQGSFTGTQLQLAMAYAAFANRGTLWTPRLVVSATAPDGSLLLATRPTVARRIPMTREDLEYVVTALRAVTTFSYGTATAAFSGFGIPVAGKSGTAETGGPDPHALFPAFAPADDPEIVVATILVRIRLGTGGSSAAPLVRRVMAAHFTR
jgi:penicillin-binding protein 2